MFGRPILLCGGLLVAAIAAAWLRAEPTVSPEGQSQLVPGRFYAVEPSCTGGSIEFPIDANGRYELIVSSLGDANRTHRVTLSAIPSKQAPPFAALRPVAEIAIGRKNTGCLNSGESSYEKPASRHTPGALAPEGRIIPSLALRVGMPQRRFFLHVTADALQDERGYIAVQGILAREGTGVRAYLDRDVHESDLAPGLVDEIIRLLDEEIFPRSRDLLGEHADVDDDGKLAILLTPWLGKLCGGRTSLKGFVRANDFQAHVEVPFGNHADVLYLNSSVEPGPALKTLLAHEYTHAVCFSRRLADPVREAPLPPEEDWLNEAIAHVAENLHGGATNLDWSNLDYRIDSFLGSPQTAPLVVRDYYRAGLWRDPGCRGATYLFLRYCVDQFGEGLLRELVEGKFTGKRNLEQATGIPFAELFRRWTIALVQDEMTSVRLHEKVGACNLAGLARREWRPETGPCEIDLRGTTTSLVVLKHSENSHAMRVVVHAEPAAKLQMTLTMQRCDEGETTKYAKDTKKEFEIKTHPTRECTGLPQRPGPIIAHPFVLIVFVSFAYFVVPPLFCPAEDRAGSSRQ